MQNIRKISGRMFANESGAMIVEFAFLIPIVVTLLLGGVEISRHILLNQKLDKVANTVADVVAQSSEVTSSDVDTLFGALDELAWPFNFSVNGKIIISNVVKQSSDALPTVRWQYDGANSCMSEYSKVGAQGSWAVMPASMDLRNAEDVIIAEVYYVYEPFTWIPGLGDRMLYKVSTYRPRLGALSTLEINSVSQPCSS